MSTHNGVHALVRRTHEERVLRVLREDGALSRAELARRVGLPRTTVSEITGELLRRGAIVVADTDAAARVGSGRPAERLGLDPASGQFMGVDFGHRRLDIAAADASHDIIASGSAQYAEDAEWDQRVAVAFGLVEELSAETGVHFGALQAIGIGVPGPYPSTTRTRRREGWGRHAPADGVDRAFADRFGADVIVDNTTRFAALAEAIDAGGDTVRDLLYVRLSGGGVGGLVVDGRLVTGSAGLAGELGHVTAVPGGRACRCGKNGCLETVASVPAILAGCRARGVAVQTLEDLQAAVTIAHPVVDQVLRDAGAALGRVLGAAALTLNPSEVVVGGRIAQVAPALVQQVASTVTFELSSMADVAPSIGAARLSDGAGALGAVAAVFHQSPLLAGYPVAGGTVPVVPRVQRSIS